jgi:hypothetical protein
MESHRSRRPINEPLSYENHEAWFHRMKLWFRGEGLWEVIQGQKELDSSRKDARAQLDIIEYLRETDQLLIRQFDTSHAQWDALKQKYEHHETRPDSLI